MAFNFSKADAGFKEATDWLSREYSRVHTGRASPMILDGVMVEAYGSMQPIKNVGSVSVEDARTLRVTLWDKSVIKEVEKAILASDIGINPSNDGRIIRLVFPALTEERRKQLSKDVAKFAEDAKVAVRQIRRDSIEKIKSMKKNSEITEDDQKKAEKDLQDLLDKYIKKADEALAAKEKELMSI